MNKPKEIILHCSATPDDRDIDIETIRKWHTEERKWKDVGYHYCIKRNGTIQIGRLETEIGAGVYRHNRDVIHVCLIGIGNYTNRQLKALDRLCLDIHIRCRIESENIKGHYEYDPNKTCPNLNMPDVRRGLHALFSASAFAAKD